MSPEIVREIDSQVQLITATFTDPGELLYPIRSGAFVPTGNDSEHLTLYIAQKYFRDEQPLDWHIIAVQKSVHVTTWEGYWKAVNSNVINGMWDYEDHFDYKYELNQNPQTEAQSTRFFPLRLQQGSIARKLNNSLQSFEMSQAFYFHAGRDKAGTPHEERLAGLSLRLKDATNPDLYRFIAIQPLETNQGEMLLGSMRQYTARPENR